MIHQNGQFFLRGNWCPCLASGSRIPQVSTGRRDSRPSRGWSARADLSILAGEPLATLSTAYGSDIEAEAATSIVGAFPVLFFKLSVAEAGAATCKCSVIVQGLVGQEY